MNEGSRDVPLPRITLLACGGTIATVPVGDEVSLRSVSELLRSVDALADVAEVEARDILARPSQLMGLADIMTVARAAVTAAKDPSVDGVVVTHGTDILEEVAFLTDLWHGGATPVVFTGAQRDASTPNGDGPGNVRDAVRVASSPQAVGRGVLVCFAGRVLSARQAQKVDSVALAAFDGPGGARGAVGGREVRIGEIERGRPLPDGGLVGPVELIRLAAGNDGALIRAAVAAGARGLAVEAFGAGTAPEDVVEAVREATAADVLVLIASRSQQGGLWRQPGAGGLLDLERAGGHPAHGLDGPKARILAMAALGACDGDVAMAVDLVTKHCVA